MDALERRAYVIGFRNGRTKGKERPSRGGGLGVLAEAGESRQVGAVFRSHERVGVSFRLVGSERTQADDPCADAAQFGLIALERPVRPRGSTFLQPGVDLPVFTASEKRELDADGLAFVAVYPSSPSSGACFHPSATSMAPIRSSSFSHTAMSRSSWGRVTDPA